MHGSRDAWVGKGHAQARTTEPLFKVAPRPSVMRALHSPCLRVRKPPSPAHILTAEARQTRLSSRRFVPLVRYCYCCCLVFPLHLHPHAHDLRNWSWCNLGSRLARRIGRGKSPRTPPVSRQRHWMCGLIGYSAGSGGTFARVLRMEVKRQPSTDAIHKRQGSLRFVDAKLGESRRAIVR